MKVKLAVVAGIALLGLAGCGERPVDGTVTHKQYSAAYTYFTHPCVSYDAKGSCRMYGIQPNYMPASYQVCVRGVDKNGEAAEGCWEVPPHEYAQWHEGDHYSARTR